MNPLRRRISAAAAGVLATGLTLPRPAFAEDQLDRILRRGLLRAAVPKDFPPFGTTRHGYPEGFDVSVARLLGIELKVPVALEAVQSADRIPYLLGDKVDIIVASLGRNAERDKLIDFSKVYAPLYLGVFGRQSVTSSQDWKDRRIGAARGSVEAAEAAAQLPTAKIVQLENSQAIIDAYARREIEFIAVGNVVVEAIPDIALRDGTLCLHVLKESPCHIGVRKGEQHLLARIDRFIDDAGPLALTVNAMIWFKSTFPTRFYQRPNAPA